jgi:hypothetical protein
MFHLVSQHLQVDEALPKEIICPVDVLVNKKYSEIILSVENIEGKPLIPGWILTLAGHTGFY